MTSKKPSDVELDDETVANSTMKPWPELDDETVARIRAALKRWKPGLWADEVNTPGAELPGITSAGPACSCGLSARYIETNVRVPTCGGAPVFECQRHPVKDAPEK